MVLTAYLVLTAWFSQAVLYCEDGSSCDLVQQSRWGTFLGIPVSFFGFLTYLALAYIQIRFKNPLSRWKSAWIVATLGLSYSLYLQAVSLIVIGEACLYCLTSLTLMAAIFTLVTLQRPQKRTDFKFPDLLKQAALMTVLLIGGMHLHYSGVFDPAAGPEDPYLKGLAQHLTQKKAVLYGAFW